METTVVYRGMYWDNGKENGNYCSGFYDVGFRALGPK